MFYGDDKKNLFITFIINELIDHIKTLEDNVYHLETVLIQIINLGLLHKVISEFLQLNKSFDLSQLFSIHQKTKELYAQLIFAGDNGGIWDVYESINTSPPHYCFGVIDDPRYQPVTTEPELSQIISLMIETTYTESTNGAADFILMQDGLLGWMDKKFYL
jgi:hypothetical protein